MTKDIKKLLKKYESEENEDIDEIEKKPAKQAIEYKKDLKVKIVDKNEKIKLDIKDRKILYELDYNARIPLGELAKKVRMSKQNLNYRLKKLNQEGIIVKYTTVVNTHALGYYSYRVYLRYQKLTENKEKEIIHYFEEHKNVIWFVSLSGNWDLEVVFLARNYVHFSNLLKEVKGRFGENFSKYDISMSPVNYHFHRDYLLDKERQIFEHIYYGFEEEKVSLDKIDTKILSELSKNCRSSSVEIAEKIGKTYHTVQDRIKMLEKKKIIQSHRILIDVSKIGRLYYKMLVNFSAVSKDEEKVIFTFCNRKSYIVYLVEVLGGWDLEIEMEVEKEEDLVNFIRELRNKFSEKIIDYITIKVQKQHKLNYFPFGEDFLES